MAFLSQFQIDSIKGKLVTDASLLGKLYKAKKSKYLMMNVDHNMVDNYIKDGWEEYRTPLKTKTPIRKLKPFARQFEDDVWCQFYELGYRCLNYDDQFILPFGKDPKETKQIDVVAINDDTIFLIECKSSAESKNAPTCKDEFDLIGLRLDGFTKAMQQIFGRNVRVKYIYATRNLRIDPERKDYERLITSKAFLYNNNTYNYINSLIKNYKKAAMYQFLGLIFKNELINSDRLEIPAVKGSMGGKKYYMFSIEPTLLLKMGFILHRTKVNESEFPTYQRLLIPSRLNGITKFIDNGGFFPNSIIVNFSSTKHRIQFEAASKTTDTSSCFGTLKIPNSYGIAYIIDGQHRVYGYANSLYNESNTIPVVAFDGLDTAKQLEIFMEINENQKAVSPSLRLDLEEDLFWGSDRADSRLKALRSSVIKDLANSQSSPLFEKISVGEDKAYLSFKPFSTALSSSGLFPSAAGNKYKVDGMNSSLYDISNLNHNDEMEKAKKRIVRLISLCYTFVEENYPALFKDESSFIISNRGTFAFINVVGSLNAHLSNQGVLNMSSTSEQRVEEMKKYLITLLDYLNTISDEEKESQFKLLGSSADTKWLRFFQSIINKKLEDYNPVELADWNERQNDELQSNGRDFGIKIEKRIKSIVLSKIKELYRDNWELEINSIKRACQERAEQEMERAYKEGLGKTTIDWTEMFLINDYKAIIDKYWTKSPENKERYPKFRTFEQDFAIDIGEKFNSKNDKLKWMSHFNSYRNLWAHEGTKEQRLNKAEVEFLEKIHGHFYPGD
jgi:DNA sulfur modification protein DndB